MALQIAGQTHAVIGRQRVGAGVFDPAGDVETYEPVPNARAGPGHRLVCDVREGALCEHQQQIAGTFQIGALERAFLEPGGQGGLVSQHRDCPVATAHRNRLYVQLGGVLGQVRVALALDGTRGKRRLHQGYVGDLGDGADSVVVDDGRRGVGSALGHADEGIVVAVHPHQVVGEREIGQQLPLGDHGVQVIDGITGQHGVLGKQITESRHTVAI
ncbi:Uncharacterised protein [Mycobacteroides abscessus subsp. abscessus]|nr:Uncharacterised protein [Mycobacteroides abscessus subsp. abscessus]